MSKEEKFWNWFKENNSKYFYLNQIIDVGEKENLLDNFLNQLHEYCDKLFFEIGGIPNETQELIITAGGDKNYFDKVDDLVSKAPKIDGWEIISLKPPMGIEFVTNYNGIKIDPRSIWFLPLENKSNPKTLGLKLCLPNYNLSRQKLFLNASYEILDTILGERSSVEDIQHVEVDMLPKDPKKEGLIELSELVKYIKWKKKQ